MGSLGHRTLVNFIESEDLGGLRGFLDLRQSQVDDRDENGTTALMIASSKGQIQYVRELLSHGAEVNAQDLDNWTSLLCASKGGFLEIVELLIENGADIEQRDMVSAASNFFREIFHPCFYHHRGTGLLYAGLATKVTRKSCHFYSNTTLIFTSTETIIYLL